MARSASNRAEEASRRREVRRLRAITGMAVFSSNVDSVAANVTSCALADDLARHLLDRLGDDRVDLAGHDRAARLQRREGDLGQARRGPEPMQPQVAGDLVEREATTLAMALASTTASCADWASKWSTASERGRPSRRRRGWRSRRGEPGRCVEAGPDRRAAEGELGRGGAARRAGAREPARSGGPSPPTSWPKVTGAASIRWVRPALTVRT